MSLDRRALLRGGMSLGALTLLTGCDLSDNDAVQGVLASSPPGTTACRRRCSAAPAGADVSRERWR